jgi:PAS domain S-box-containing protein
VRDLIDGILKKKDDEEHSQEAFDVMVSNAASKYVRTAVIGFNVNDEILSWNLGAEYMFERTSTEMKKRLLLEIIPPEYQAEHIEWLRIYRETKITQTGSKLIRTALKKDGSRIPVELNFFLDNSIQGMPDLFVVTIQDLTEIQDLKNQVKKDVNRFTRYEEIGGYGGWDWDLKTDDVKLTPGGSDIFDMPVGKLIKSIDLIERLHEDDRKEVNYTIIEAEKKNADYETSYRVKKNDKSVIRVYCKAKAIKDEFGNVKIYEGIVQEIPL